MPEESSDSAEWCDLMGRSGGGIDFFLLPKPFAAPLDAERCPDKIPVLSR